MKRAVPLLLLGLAGFAGNWFKLQLFLSVDFLFGSFFVMLAIARYGMPGACITGLLAASCTALLWHHPWAIIIFAGEAFFVATCERRRPDNILIHDTAYWLCLGMPLVWLFYHVVMGMPLQATLMIALKQSINGIFNALLATLFIYVAQLLRSTKEEHEQLIPFQQLIFMGLIAITLVPAFAHMVQDVKTDMAHEETEQRLQVKAVAEGAQGVLATWLSNNHQTVIALSQLVGDPNRTPFATMQQRVEELKLANPNLIRLGVFNRQATTVAFCPLVDNTGKSTLGINFSDRPYVSTIRQTLRPYVSDVTLGRIGLPRPPILMLVAPVVINGSYGGYCTGIVDFDQLTSQLRVLVKDISMDITIVDRQGRVVVSTTGHRRTMQPFSRPAGGETRQLPDGMYQWIPETEKIVTSMQRWQRSLYVKETALSTETPWTIVVEASMAPTLKAMTKNAINELAVMWGLILFAMAISYLLSKRFVVSMKQLEYMTSALPQRLTSSAMPEWPTSKINELHSLITNFKAMAEALGGHIRQQQSMNEELERTNKELEGFCYAISHELRAPIARLEGFSNLLAECLDQADPDTLCHLAGRIGVSSQRLRSVIDSLLMINRLSRSELNVEWVDLSELARQTLAELREDAGERPLRITVKQGMMAHGDRHLLGICLRNLLGNAFKYTGKTPQAEIEVGVSDHNVFFVRDNGAGFDMTYADKLFRPFSRLHRENEYQGEGIGLATVQRIIERHGGRIWVEAAPDLGATFYFTLGTENGGERAGTVDSAG